MSIRRLTNPSRISGSSIAAVSAFYGRPVQGIAGLQLWLDASDGNTLYDATSGGSLVTNGNAVARWEDKSGNARHFTQGTANNRPTLRTSSLNSLSTLEFDGTNDRLSGDTTQYVKSNSPFTIYIVYKVESSSGNYPALFGTKTNQTENWRIIEADTSQTSYRTFGFGSASAAFATARANSTTRGNWYVGHISIGGGANAVSNYSASINNSTVTLSASGAYGTETGANASIGAQADNLNFLKGNVAELIIYDSQLSFANHTIIMNYLKRWALY